MSEKPDKPLRLETEALFGAFDASLIAADANKQRSIAGQDWRRKFSEAELATCRRRLR
jgi:hypothetical protein